MRLHHFRNTIESFLGGALEDVEKVASAMAGSAELIGERLMARIVGCLARNRGQQMLSEGYSDSLKTAVGAELC